MLHNLLNVPKIFIPLRIIYYIFLIEEYNYILFTMLYKLRDKYFNLIQRKRNVIIKELQRRTSTTVPVLFIF